MNMHAKTILENKFWIIERDEEKFATLRKIDEKKYQMSNEDGVLIFDNRQSIIKKFGKDFFLPVKKIKEEESINELNGFLCNHKPFNAVFDIKKKLPLFTKSIDSKSLYFAGYYIIKFNKGWVKSFCPKLITLQRYQYKGPFRTELEMKQVLSNVSK